MLKTAKKLSLQRSTQHNKFTNNDNEVKTFCGQRRRALCQSQCTAPMCPRPDSMDNAIEIETPSWGTTLLTTPPSRFSVGTINYMDNAIETPSGTSPLTTPPSHYSAGTIKT